MADKPQESGKEPEVSVLEIERVDVEAHESAQPEGEVCAALSARELREVALVREAHEVPLQLRRRGLGVQRHTRTLLAELEAAVCEIVERAHATLKIAYTTLARLFSMARNTLYNLRRRSRQSSAAPAPLGRARKAAGVIDRNRVIVELTERGPGASVASVREVAPELARREVELLVRRFRRVYRRRCALRRARLTWHGPQVVWAIDHATPPTAIDGKYEAIFAVRDLGSRAQLLWAPVLSFGAEEAIAWLECLVAEYGTPLVVKADNGPAFISAAMHAFWERHGIEPLYSPVRRPSYNGSCEAAVGAMKLRTHEVASEGSRPGLWEAGDLTAALARSQLERPPLAALTGAQGLERRRAFRATVADERHLLRAEYELSEAEAAEPERAAVIERQSLRRALIGHGILSTRRRRISPPESLLN